MEVFSFTSCGKELDFVMGAGSLEPVSRDCCLACFSRRCLEVSGAKSRDILELCALRKRGVYVCERAEERCGRVGEKWIQGKAVRSYMFANGLRRHDVRTIQAGRANLCEYEILLVLDVP